MAKITIEEIKKRVRPLTRGEIKSLKEFGYTYFGCLPTMEQANDALDKAFNIQLSGEDQAFLDTCTNKDARSVWEEILKETYGAKDEEKNFQSTSDGSLIKSE